jgi:phosphohistidine phosphatase
MGEWMLEKGLRPDVILSSTAKRASQTTELVLAAIDYHDSVTWLDKLYHASPQTMLDAVATVDGRAKCVLLVAHNPGMEELVSVLGKNFVAMPTAAIAHFELTSDDWAIDPDDSTIRLIEIAKPKEL